MAVRDLLSFRDYFNIIRQLSFRELDGEARDLPAILVVAESRELAVLAGEALFGHAGAAFVEAHAFDAQLDPLRYDVILTIDRLPTKQRHDWSRLFNRAHEELRLIEVLPRVVGDAEAERAARTRVVDRAEEKRLLALGRHIPLLRAACAHRVVWDTSMADGQFALVSNIPEVVPIIGNLIAAGADFLVLTKNQLLMLYKLAAIFGRDLGNRRRIYSEMLPVVGAGLVWRTVARELVTLMPFGLGTVPKVAIAFAGTWAVGQAAVVYYESGEKLSREQMRGLYAEALELLRHLPLGKKGEPGDEEPPPSDRAAAD